MRIIFVYILIFSFLSCNNDDDHCDDTYLPLTSLEAEYGCANTEYDLQIDLIDDYVIITNQLEFDQLVSGECHPQINFFLYDLVIGKQGLTSGISSIEYELYESCEYGDVVLEVTFNQNATLIAPNLTYHALIPKLGDETPLYVDIIID